MLLHHPVGQNLWLRSWRLVVIAVLLWFAATTVANASGRQSGDAALWEIGGGIGAVAFPNYRGSREYNLLAAPLPSIIYRGDIFKVSRDGVRAELVDHPRFDISISGGGSLPVDSDDDELRRGMPDLDPALKVGPKLSWLFSDPARRERYSLRFHMPIYGVVATDLRDVQTIGALIHPNLSWRQRWLSPGRNRTWSYALSIGALWATGEYHDYYYSVASRFATPARPAFNAVGGYSGLSATGGLYYQRGRLRVGAYMSLDHLQGAAFEDSPLVATTASYVGGLYLAWTLWESEARALGSAQGGRAE